MNPDFGLGIYAKTGSNVVNAGAKSLPKLTVLTVQLQTRLFSLLRSCYIRFSMKKQISLQSDFTEYESIEDLPETDRLLVEEARKSAGQAYAPYSHFQVGAALRLENGVILRGNNQENASYPIGLCAERVAVFAAGANYPGVRILSLAITANSHRFHVNKPITPCGACRQAIAEYEHRYKQSIRLIMVGESGKVLVADSINHFLPYQFNADDLQVKTS